MSLGQLCQRENDEPHQKTSRWRRLVSHSKKSPLNWFLAWNGSGQIEQSKKRVNRIVSTNQRRKTL
jgi:hypothetical protein